MSTPNGADSLDPVRLAIVGTGIIGRVHAEVCRDLPNIAIQGMSGLDGGAAALAGQIGTTLFSDYRDLADLDIEAVIIASPNELHLEMGRFFASRGIHLLIEKPIADSLAAGAELCQVADDNKVHILVGHHRRHHDLVEAARKFVSTDMGSLVATNTLVTMRKPDSYYEVEWRRGESAGPLLVNLIHEVDLLRAVCGEIEAVQATATKANRRFAFDDTAAILIHYANGALGTLVISESTPSPWSWEASVSDGMGFHNAGQDHAQFIGAEASLGFPSLTVWRYDNDEPDPGWNSPLRASRLSPPRGNPYVAQIDHLFRVVRGLDTPRVSGVDGLRSLAVVNAVTQAAWTGEVADVDALLANL